ncbi:NADPH-dependent 7-cyano-7-deazaguanine reductase QueF [Helicobacter monodelphidis]|uniref:preQ(1) synthase n=1 Tax=Helicobacter sp. 15-1451 TaxID=2004995 RepID=UPI000DCD059A|nr:preQ(1) synthase [Helicobacter sp. 15-1451]RAX56833.1 NADPH-dependent 7-cyano-7-deazaguanine reductase QueF [Helicobacter sp. 15-1451]
MKYGEKEITEFNPDEIEIWENKNDRFYTIRLTLPEFTCLCPRSGYPDFATIYVDYVPQRYVIELKAIKIYINSFRTRYISHEDSVNEIYSLLWNKLQPKELVVKADFYPRGNVHTIIEVDSRKCEK